MFRVTSVSTSSFLYQLAKNPEKQEKLYGELKEVLPTPDTPLDVKKMERLSYLKACIKETLRCFQPMTTQLTDVQPMTSQLCTVIKPQVSIILGYAIERELAKSHGGWESNTVAEGARDLPSLGGQQPGGAFPGPGALLTGTLAEVCLLSLLRR
ncbi:hypothetical protein ANN_25627 [Periplaneta americana]|uniref:Cytochrome P450 n=1 Tax=Periplaneta americana TaxID=6978 RepID=A0ABQ8S1N8_PERAM|nr:hypothetical protein ANN_25627 [Periplaneta americana]